ncbi:MAG TPA: hypothetical protein VHZ51_15290 [Ktedonobacteraceae bacterium]|nr:hypothetical protein [Ktedonobacteraceae bacterium]
MGMLAIGLAAYARRFLPITSAATIEQRLHHHAKRSTIGLAQLMTYGMLGILCVVLTLNVFSSDPLQLANRPVLTVATMLVIALVVVRQILTIYENERLTIRQASALERLGAANQQIEEQSRQIAEKNNELEEGINHLKDVQARIANGNMRTRARLNSGTLLPLAASLNLMVERLMYLEQANDYAQRLTRALQELIFSVEQARNGAAFRFPPSCKQFPEIGRLLYVFGLKERVENPTSSPGSVPNSTPIHLAQRPTIPPSFSGVKPPARPRVSQSAGRTTSLFRTTDSLHGDSKAAPAPGKIPMHRQDTKDETGKS